MIHGCYSHFKVFGFMVLKDLLALQQEPHGFFKIILICCKTCEIQFAQTNTNLIPNLNMEFHRFSIIVLCFFVIAKVQENICNASLNDQKVALFIGSEESGLSVEVQKKLDLVLKINMNDTIESLNASVAAGIAMSYFFKKK